jgi:phosphatidate cytidylyltransferase
LGNFLRRTLTAVWIVIFVLGGFWLHPVSFFITGLLILAGAQYEYYLMIRNSGIRPQMISGIFAGTALYTISTLVAASVVPAGCFLLMVPVTLLVMIIELYRKEEKPFDSLAHTLFAVIYIAIPFSMFPFSAFSKTGLSSLLPHGSMLFSPGLVVGFFLILWANDTGAYITGVLLGHHRLMERISPKKSWEGFFGGAIVAVLAAWLLSQWLGVVGNTGWIIIAVIISCAGTFGDLIESMLKRSMGVKDSGTIMPGHGGFLDRFDSAVLSFPLVFLFISLFG